MPVKIEDAGVCKKKLVFEIPHEEIQEKIEKTLDELVKEAQIPGFRPGHAPRRLVQRKLRDQISEQVKAELLSDNYKKAVEENKLEVLREEEFDIEKIELPESGPMVFDVEVEVKPEVEVPDYSSIPVEITRPHVSDADKETALNNLRRSRGRFAEQAADSAIEQRDMLTADVTVAVGSETLFEQQDASLPVFPQAVAGIRFDNLADELTGKKAGDKAAFTAVVPDSFEKEELRGKDAEMTVHVKSVRRIALPPLDDEFAKSVGMQTADEVVQAVTQRLESDASQNAEDQKRIGIGNWLLDNVKFEVPEGVAAANAGRVFNQQVVNLQRQGVPVEQIREQADALMQACRDRSQRELKLSFILESIAKKEKLEVTEDEIQARVGMIAEAYRRPVDRLYEDMVKNGQLEAVSEQIRDDKVFQLLLSKANITEKEPEPAPAPGGEAKPKAAKKRKASTGKADKADAEGAEESKADE